MEKILLVGAGGFLGSIARYLFSTFIYRLSNGFVLPFGTLSVNLIGCLLIGFLAGIAEFRGLLSSEMRLFLLVGILGGFTTFSTFGYETFQLLRDGQVFASAMNICLSVFLGIACVYLGFILAKLI